MSDPIDKLYEEASNSVRHYSGAILTLKGITIAQGFALLAAQGFLHKPGANAFLSLGLGVFGLLFTMALYFIGLNLMSHFNALLAAAQALEKQLCPDHPNLGPWSTFEPTSIRKAGNPEKNPFVRAMTLHGHIVMLLVAFLSVIIYSIVGLIR